MICAGVVVYQCLDLAAKSSVWKWLAEVSIEAHK